MKIPSRDTRFMALCPGLLFHSAPLHIFHICAFYAPPASFSSVFPPPSCVRAKRESAFRSFQRLSPDPITSLQHEVESNKNNFLLHTFAFLSLKFFPGPGTALVSFTSTPSEVFQPRTEIVADFGRKGEEKDQRLPTWYRS